MFFTFFTCHSLCFFLLTTLIFPACAVPTPPSLQFHSLDSATITKYKVIPYNRYGIMIAVSRETLHNIEVSIAAMPQKEMRDTGWRTIELAENALNAPHQPQESSSTFYFELRENDLCVSPRRCFGYVVLPHDGVMFGSLLVAQNGIIVAEIHKPLTQVEAEAESLAQYSAFLTQFAKIERWVRRVPTYPYPFKTRASVILQNAAKNLIEQQRREEEKRSKGEKKRLGEDKRPPAHT